jgi:hypothetical protein
VKLVPPLGLTLRRKPPLFWGTAEGLGTLTVGQPIVTVTVALSAVLLQLLVTRTQYVVVDDGVTRNGFPLPIGVPLPDVGPWNHWNVKPLPPEAVVLRENAPPLCGVAEGAETLTVGQEVFTVTVAVALFTAGVHGPLTSTQ